MTEHTGAEVSAASVQRMDKRSNFRKVVERCARMGVRVSHNGITWRLQGGPAGVDFGALDLSTVKARDLTSRGRNHGDEQQA